MRSPQLWRSLVLTAFIVTAFAGCASQTPPPDAGPSLPSDSATSQLTWNDACLLTPKILNPILARSTSEPNAKIGAPRDGGTDRPTCEYRPLASPAAYPLVTLYDYGSDSYRFLSMSQASQQWSAPDATHGYRDACRAAKASAHADGGTFACHPKVRRGAVYGATEAVVFLDDEHFAVVQMFDISYQDAIMPTLMDTAIKQITTAWAQR